MVANRLVEENRLASEAATADGAWRLGLAAWLEVLLTDEATADNALDAAVSAELADRRARRQAVERRHLEAAMQAEAAELDASLNARLEESAARSDASSWQRQQLTLLRHSLDTPTPRGRLGQRHNSTLLRLEAPSRSRTATR